VLPPDGKVTRIQRAETLGQVSKITRQKARAVLRARIGTVNHGQRRPGPTPVTFSLSLVARHELWLCRGERLAWLTRLRDADRAE
jgi:hypothetical protein